MLFPYQAFLLIEPHEGNIIEIVLTEKYAIAVTINGTPIAHLSRDFVNTPDKDPHIYSTWKTKINEFKKNISNIFTIRPINKLEMSYFTIGFLKYFGYFCAVIALFLLLYNIGDSSSLDSCLVFILIFTCLALCFCFPKHRLSHLDVRDVYCLRNAKVVEKEKGFVTIEYVNKKFQFSYPEYWFDFMPAIGGVANVEVAYGLKNMVKCNRLSINNEVESFGAPHPTIFNKIWLITSTICLLWVIFATDNIANFIYTYSRLTNSQTETIDIDDYPSLQNSSIDIGDWLKLDVKPYCDINKLSHCNNLIITPRSLDVAIAKDQRANQWLSHQHEKLLNSTKPNLVLLHTMVNAISDVCDMRELTSEKQSQCEVVKDYLISKSIFGYYGWERVKRDENYYSSNDKFGVNSETFYKFRELAFDLINDSHEQNRSYLIEFIQNHQNSLPIKIEIIDMPRKTDYKNSGYSNYISKNDIKVLLKAETFNNDVLVTGITRDDMGKIEKIDVSIKSIGQKKASTIFSSAIVSTIFTVATVLFLLLQIILIIIAKYKNKVRINRIVDYLRYYTK